MSAIYSSLKVEFLDIGKMHCIDLATRIQKSQLKLLNTSITIMAAVVLMAIVVVMTILFVKIVKVIIIIVIIVAIMAIVTDIAFFQSFQTQNGYQMQGICSGLAKSSSP